MKSLWSVFDRKPAPPLPVVRQHLAAAAWPAVVYAVGDVHGCADLLASLMDRIVADARDIEGERWLVMLGDYVDRGPDSARVLDMLLSPPPAGFRRFNLAGNHEVMMLAFLDNPETNPQWLDYGGREALASYGLSSDAMSTMTPAALGRELAQRLPVEHLELLRSLPLSLSLPGTVFVHAGIRRGVPMPEQIEADVLWIRRAFHDADPVDDLLVVHGHTPGPVPVVEPRRICIDTGAYATGRLTAFRLSTGSPPVLMSTAD